MVSLLSKSKTNIGIDSGQGVKHIHIPPQDKFIVPDGYDGRCVKHLKHHQFADHTRLQAQGYQRVCDARGNLHTAGA